MAVVLSLLALVASGTLLVQRTPEASDCPDAPALTAMITRLTSKAPKPADVTEAGADRFDVEFSRSASRYRVILRTGGARAGVRTLHDASSTCASLAEATALTIALIVDPEGAKRPDPAPPPPTTPPPAETTTPDVVPPPRGVPPSSGNPVASLGRGPAWGLGVDARAGVGLGIVRSAAPLGVLAIEIRPTSIVSIDVGGLFIPTQRLALERGSVGVWLLVGAANGCIWPYAAALRIGGCVGIAAGAIRAEGRGYPAESGASRPWVAATAAAAASGPIAWRLRWTGRAGIVVPTRRESFGVEGAGIAYEAPSVGGLIAAGLSVSIR